MQVKMLYPQTHSLLAWNNGSVAKLKSQRNSEVGAANIIVGILTAGEKKKNSEDDRWAVFTQTK